MEIMKNMAAAIQTYKALSGKSYTAFADYLGISCSMLKTYASGNGNPSAYMLELISEKFGVDPFFFILGDYSKLQGVALKRLMEYINLLSMVPAENREEFIDRSIQLLDLLKSAESSKK